MMQLHDMLTFLMLGSVLLFVVNMKWQLPGLTILNRWLNWITFSLVFAHLIQLTELSDKPYPLLAVTLFLSWFLVETLYTWFGIRSLNYSPATLFPRFKVNRSGAQWPNEKSVIGLRDYLRRHQFSERESVNSYIFESLYIPSTLFLDKTRRIRLQILFLPTKSGKPSMVYVLTSLSSGGGRYITDNVPMPYGGYYPEEWYPCRKPLIKSFDKLLRLHKKRLDESGEVFRVWECDLCDDLNKEQHALQKLNMEEGFLMPAHMQNAYGQLTLDGRYRIWKEVWLLKYLGLAPN